MVELESPRALATRLGWTERRIRTLIANRLIRHVRVGNSIFVPHGAIEEFIDRNTVVPIDEPAR